MMMRSTGGLMLSGGRMLGLGLAALAWLGSAGWEGGAVGSEEARTVVTIEASDPRGSEGGVLTVIDPVVFTVHRRGDLADRLTVFYSTGGTAENGVDYERLAGEVEIPSGSATAEIEVVPIADGIEEGTESVVLRLEEPACIAIYPPPPGCYAVGVPGRAAGWIADGPVERNRPPRVELVRPFPGAVYHAPATIHLVGQARDPDGYVTGIEWYANDRLIGEERLDFLVPPPAGERQLFEFKWQGVPEGRFQLTARVTDDQGLVSAWSEPVRVAVLGEREVPVVMLFVVDPVAREGSSRDGSVDTATFKVRRSGGTEEPLEVYYEVTGTAENGVDYARLEGRLSLAAGSRWGRIVVTPVDDRLEEGPETVVVRIVPSPVAAPVEPYRVGWPAVAAALILDDEVTDVPTQRIRDWLKLRLECERGAAYRLEASIDLREWEGLREGWAPDGVVEHVELEPNERSQRFYRLRMLAPEVMESGSALGQEW
jgi:hypothetical protein